MSGPDLTTRLDELARRAPVVGVDAEALWEQGHTSRRRRNVLTVVAAAAAVALLAGLVAWLPGRTTPEPATTSTVPGVPHELWVPVDRLDQVPMASGLDVGRSAAVLGMGDGRQGALVAVDGADGSYRRLPVSDAVGFMSPPVVALSPDGRRLAYGYGRPEPEMGIVDETQTTGVAVVDLDTGTTTRAPIGAVGDVILEHLRWSPGSRWLVTVGVPTSSGRVVGRVAPGSETWQQVRLGGAAPEADVAIGDNGDVYAATSDQLVQWSDGVTRTAPLRGESHRGPLKIVRSRTLFPTHGVLDGVDIGSLPWTQVGNDGVGSGDSRPLDLPPLGRQDLFGVAGWVGDRPLLRISPATRRDSYSVAGRDGRLVAYDAGTGRSTPLVVVHGVTGADISVATDLLADGRRPVPRPRPPWLDARESTSAWWWGGGALVVLAAAGGVLLLRRRGRRLRTTA